MAWRLIRQPNGKLARFSEIVDDFTHTNMTDKEAREYCCDCGGTTLAEEKITNADNEPDRFDEAIEIIKMCHGSDRAYLRKAELSESAPANEATEPMAVKTEHIPFNINEYVRVRLTDRGRKLHRKQHDEIYASVGAKISPEYRPPTEDKDGWSRWQLWYLMMLFGDDVYIARPLAFETNIELCCNE